MIGRCEKFWPKLGYGFITTPELSEDVMVHYSEIQEEGFKQLREGDEVEFELVEIEQNGKTRYRAKNVKKSN